MSDKPIVDMGAKYGKSSAQILLRWALQHNVVVIPKATTKERIEQNANVFDFEISQEDMNKLNSMNKNYHCTWDPTTVL